MNYKQTLIFLLILSLAFSCKKDDDDPLPPGNLQLTSISVGPEELSLDGPNEDLAFNQPVVIRFSQAVDTATVPANVSLLNEQEEEVELDYFYLDNDRTISALPVEELEEDKTYTIRINEGLKGRKGETFPGLSMSFTTRTLPLHIIDLSINDIDITGEFRITGISFYPEIKVVFSDSMQAEKVANHSSLKLGSMEYSMEVLSQGDSAIIFNVLEELPYYRKFIFRIDPALSDEVGRDFEGLEIEFYTRLDSSFKFPAITDEQLLDLVQEQTFKYFWDFAHPVSGLIRERNTSGDVVTSGGSGFGVMAIIVGIERDFITRTEGIQRWNTIVDFLAEADRFHGAWSHWLNGRTGDAVRFSPNDDGGDLVETSYMAMGLMTVRQYLDPGINEESELITKINSLLNSIEWDWYTQGENSLTWHWSPNYGFEKNLKIRGWNEALITYVMAAASEEHGISAEVYHEGWAGGSNMINGNEYFDIQLPLGRAYGGPLFFEHYSFLGIDPRNLEDQYANYWTQAVNHTLINRAYSIVNPKNYVGYSEDSWGLTASDGDQGYSAHAPGNDRGVIAPTAAISSIPYTPEYSMDAIRHFYYLLGDKLWGPYGFHDAFNVTNNWYADSYLAIDQGPIILMIENHRTALLWELFMSAPEIQDALTQLGFSY